MSQRKKALYLWSDFQRLDFSDEKVLHLWSDLLKFEADKSLKQQLLLLLLLPASTTI